MAVSTRDDGMRVRVAASLLLGVWLLGGCALAPQRSAPASPLRLSEWAEVGDAQRRASMRLVLEGLTADERAQVERARSQYELALQVDAANPFAYLALARHHADGVEPERALAFLDQARSLLRSEQVESPRVDALLFGLRGQALRAVGRYNDAEPWLERARALSPVVWRDGILDPAELR